MLTTVPIGEVYDINGSPMSDKYPNAVGLYTRHVKRLGMRSGRDAAASRGTFTHELGHHVDAAFLCTWSHGDPYVKVPNEKLRKQMLKDLRREHRLAVVAARKVSGMKNAVQGARAVGTHAVSSYALTDRQEWFAEHFQCYMSGHAPSVERMARNTPKTYAAIEALCKGELFQ